MARTRSRDLARPGLDEAAVQVDARLGADAGIRNRWKADSGMLVLSFWDPEHRCPTVDIFCEYPMDFETLYRDSQIMPPTGSRVRVASVDHLIAIKRAAGRPKDLEDAARLAEIAGLGKCPAASMNRIGNAPPWL